METNIQQALESVTYPGFSRDIVSFGIVHGAEVSPSGEATVRLRVATRNPEVHDALRRGIASALGAVEGIHSVRVEIGLPEAAGGAAPPPPAIGPSPSPEARPAPNPDPWADRAPLPGIRRILAVASGKGGVGKSTIASNLAVALRRMGHSVGLMDADIYGPSIHVMMGAAALQPEVDERRRIVPLETHGVKLMSMGFIADPDDAMIWRGPMVMKAVQQFLKDVRWGALDCLVVDMPPGTGDAQLTLVQQTPLSGAVIVSTPQEISLIDARRAMAMFRKVDVPICGLVENMSHYVEASGRTVDLFDRGGVQREARKAEVPFLGEIPLHIDVRKCGDLGAPLTVRQPDHPISRTFIEMARTLDAQLSLSDRDHDSPSPQPNRRTP